MAKISKLLKALSLIIRKPALLNLVLDDEQVNREQVIRQYGLKEGLPVVNLFTTQTLTVSPYANRYGGSSFADLALLRLLAARFNPCRYFEIGTWMGESVANVAAVAKECVTMNLPDTRMQELGLAEDYIALHRFFSGSLPNVTHLQADSLEFDFEHWGEKFDLIFIDGDHHYESVKKDTANAFRLLKDEHSIIVWHDYGNTPADIRWDVFRGILEGTPAEKRNNLYRAKHTLCAVYLPGKVVSTSAAAFEAPTQNFNIEVTIESLKG